MLHCFSIIITIIDFINPPFSLFPNTPAHSPTLSSLIFLFTRANQTFSHVEHLRTSAFLFFFFPFSFFYIYMYIYISLHSLLHTHAFGCSLIVSYYYFFFFWIIPSVEEAVVDDQVRSKKKKNERWRVYRGDNLTFDWRISDQKGYKGSIITRNERFLIFPLGSSSNFLPGHLVYTSLWVYSFAYYRTVYVVCRLLFTFACRQLHDNFTLRLQKEREYLNVYALFIYLFIFFFFPLILKSFLGLLLKKKFSRSSPLWTPVSLPLLFFCLFLSFFCHSETFDKRRLERKYRRSICFPFPTLENRTKIDGSRHAIHAKLCRICNHVEAETNWIGGEVEGKQFGENISNSSRSKRLSVFFYNSSPRKKITSTSFWFFAYSWSLFRFQPSVYRSQNQFDRFCTRSIPSPPSFVDAIRLCTANLLYLFIYFFCFL